MSQSFESPPVHGLSGSMVTGSRSTLLTRTVPHDTEHHPQECTFHVHASSDRPSSNDIDDPCISEGHVPPPHICKDKREFDCVHVVKSIQETKLELSATSEYREADNHLDLPRGVYPDSKVEKYKTLLHHSDDSLDSTASSYRTMERARERCRELKGKLRQRCTQLRELRTEFRLLCKATEQSQQEHFKLETLLRKTIAEEEHKITSLHSACHKKHKELQKEKFKTLTLLQRFHEQLERNARLEQTINERMELESNALPVQRGSREVLEPSTRSLWEENLGTGDYRALVDHPFNVASCSSSSCLSSSVLSSGFRDTLKALPPQRAAEIVAQISRVLERLLVDEISPHHFKSKCTAQERNSAFRCFFMSPLLPMMDLSRLHLLDVYPVRESTVTRPHHASPYYWGHHGHLDSSSSSSHSQVVDHVLSQVPSSSPPQGLRGSIQHNQWIPERSSDEHPTYCTWMKRQVKEDRGSHEKKMTHASHGRRRDVSHTGARRLLASSLSESTPYRNTVREDESFSYHTKENTVHYRTHDTFGSRGDPRTYTSKERLPRTHPTGSTESQGRCSRGDTHHHEDSSVSPSSARHHTMPRECIKCIGQRPIARSTHWKHIPPRLHDASVSSTAVSASASRSACRPESCSQRDNPGDAHYLTQKAAQHLHTQQKTRPSHR